MVLSKVTLFKKKENCICLTQDNSYFYDSV